MQFTLFIFGNVCCVVFALRRYNLGVITGWEVMSIVRHTEANIAHHGNKGEMLQKFSYRRPMSSWKSKFKLCVFETYGKQIFINANINKLRNTSILKSPSTIIQTNQ